MARFEFVVASPLEAFLCLKINLTKITIPANINKKIIVSNATATLYLVLNSISVITVSVSYVIIGVVTVPVVPVVPVLV